MKKRHVCLLSTALLCAIMLTSCGGGSGTSIISKTPFDVVKASLTAIKDKNFPEALKYIMKKDGTALTKEENEKLTGLLTLVSKELEKKQGMKEIQMVEEKISQDGNTAIVKYRIVYNDGTTEDKDTNLAKVNGDWFMVIGN